MRKAKKEMEGNLKDIGIKVIKRKTICNIKGKKRYKYNQDKAVSIIELEPCQKAKVSYVKGNEKIIQRLSDLGLTPRSEVIVLRKTKMNGPIEVSVRRTTLAIAKDIAYNIFVKPC